jgi:hypothetical protein
MEFHDVKLLDVFEHLLGKEEAGKFANEVNRGIKRGLQGDELQTHIKTVWDKYKDKAQFPDEDSRHHAGLVVLF